VAARYDMGPYRSQGLIDVLDRILDKGLVVAGDIKINLANVELLTIQIRLLVCSIDKAEQIGMNWWRTDPSYAKPEIRHRDLQMLHEKLDEMSTRLATLEQAKLPQPKKQR
jgi:hypothetical protein